MSQTPPLSAPTTPRRTRLTAEQRREVILDAATEVFADVGYQHGKVSDIARRIGVSEPVVFQNFGTKAALFSAVLERATHQITAQLRAAADTGQSVPDLLAAWLAPEHIDRMHSRGSMGVLFADMLGPATAPEVHDAARTAVQQMIAGIADLLRQGQRDGDIRPDLDPETGAWWLMSLLNSHHFRTAVMDDRTAIESGLTRLLLESLTRPAEVREP
ncbi:TetR/AcrR family transcriptional regulator [Streptomyces sp. MK37H]|uniref:TetR/AcrR family transcriptional regulator n=1 Tax=Streptomyces sp. MK37H TaxID=2699117 RepID=UPI001B36DE36|nr:TetR/AcrR family transcriptional regulator [Streptomyces sp. MK37H]MBP8535539.1 TetR family transcriptional regulator [Streptomyces sp. MK37H]